MVAPERETPGIMANPWANPMMRADFSEIDIKFFCFRKLRENNNKVVIKRPMLTIKVELNSEWVKGFNIKPMRPVGMVARRMALTVGGFIESICLRKKIIMARSVPR